MTRYLAQPFHRSHRMFAIRMLRSGTSHNFSFLLIQVCRKSATSCTAKKQPHIQHYNLSRRAAPYRNLKYSKDALSLFSRYHENFLFGISASAVFSRFRILEFSSKTIRKEKLRASSKAGGMLRSSNCVNTMTQESDDIPYTNKNEI